jgi:hypothetical protein
MTVVRRCACDLPLCPHPRFPLDDPACKNWPEGMEMFCKECQTNRPAALIAMEESKLDSK